MAVSGVYVITNTVNGRRYVGSSADVRHRWVSHKSLLRRGKHHITRLQQDWDAHGPAAFHLEVIAYEDNTEKRLAIEQALVTAYDSAQFGYNLINTNHRPGEAKPPLRAASAGRGKPKSPDHRARIWENREVTPQFRDQMRRNGQLGRGKAKSAGHRLKITEAQRGSRNHQARLTEDDVRAIKRRLADGEAGRAIAADYGVSEVTISNIKRGRRWGHVT